MDSQDTLANISNVTRVQHEDYPFQSIWLHDRGMDVPDLAIPSMWKLLPAPESNLIWLRRKKICIWVTFFLMHKTGSSGSVVMEANMEVQQEKIYVLVGKDLEEGLKTLVWTLKNWPSQSISIVVLHVGNDTKDFVKTPFGKLPASTVSSEKLEIFRLHEMFQYKALCRKVKVEPLKAENPEEPLHSAVVGFISRNHVKKFVMSITCMKSTSSRKIRNGIGGSFYVHKYKPDYCQLFITCGGKLVNLKEENDQGYSEDEEAAVISAMRKKVKEKGSSKGWLQNVASFVIRKSPESPGQTSTTSTTEPDEKWDDCAEEIEIYLQWLTTNSTVEEEDNSPQISPAENVQSENIDPNLSTPAKIEVLKAKIEEAKKKTVEKRNETRTNADRGVRAERVISLCNRRAQFLEAKITEELAQQNHLKNELDKIKEEVEEATNDVLEGQSRLKSALELRRELTDILHVHSLEKTSIEARLEKALTARAETIREIDELRRQRDILRRRLYFCRERSAAASIPSKNPYSNYREFTAAELGEATDYFSDSMKLAARVYKGKINHAMVAIKLENSMNQSEEEFQSKVRILCQIRHPNIITVVGACTDVHPPLIVYEYMHNRSLRDLLFGSKAQILPWPTRIRIASEISATLAFLHGTRPIPTPHANLKPSNVLLDRALVAKLADLRVTNPHRRPSAEELESDIRDLGILILQMLTGREDVAVEEVEEEVEGGGGDLTVDERAGEWPLDVAMAMARLGAQCVQVSGGGGGGGGLEMARVAKEVEELRRKAEGRAGAERDDDLAESCDDAPGMFLCPILQEVMKQPCVAADGFSYELEAIEEWLGSGHDTSPMTNLRLKNKLLTPNHTLRSLILEWQNSRSRP